MSWQALTTDDFQGSLNATEAAAIAAIATQNGGTDPIAKAIARVTSEVRSAVQSNEKNILGPEGTIPSECTGYAADLAAWYVITGLSLRNPDILEQGKDKKKDALDFLNRVRNGDVKIVQPDTASSEVVPRQTLVTVRNNPPRNTRRDMRSI